MATQKKKNHDRVKLELGGRTSRPNAGSAGRYCTLREECRKTDWKGRIVGHAPGTFFWYPFRPFRSVFRHILLPSGTPSSNKSPGTSGIWLNCHPYHRSLWPQSATWIVEWNHRSLWMVRLWMYRKLTSWMKCYGTKNVLIHNIVLIHPINEKNIYMVIK